MTRPAPSHLSFLATHSVHFQRRTDKPLFRASCTCGWSVEGTCEEVQTKAATHDLDESARG